MEFTFKVDFKNKCFDYILKDNDFKITNAPLEGELIKDKNITLIYRLDNDEKKIIVDLL